MILDNKKALKKESEKFDSFIIAQNRFDFVFQDFSKSGISQSVINDYKDKKFLKCTPTSWILNYPDLLTNERTSYTTRYQNSTTTRYGNTYYTNSYSY